MKLVKLYHKHSFFINYVYYENVKNGERIDTVCYPNIIYNGFVH
jgi:hypothetical protein